MATERAGEQGKGQQETKGKAARSSRERSERGTELAPREGFGLPSLFGERGFSPFGMMRRMMEDMDRMFEDLGFRGGRELRRGFGGERPWAPEIEVAEREGRLFVRADLPGLSRDDVHVELREDSLVLEGERRHEHEEERGGTYRSERSYGSFRRMIPLPEGVDPQKCEAHFDKGVLEIAIELPKERVTQGKKIEIKEGKAGTVH